MNLPGNEQILHAIKSAYPILHPEKANKYCIKHMGLECLDYWYDECVFFFLHFSKYALNVLLILKWDAWKLIFNVWRFLLCELGISRISIFLRGGGGWAQTIMCVNAHQECEAQSPNTRALEALGGF